METELTRIGYIKDFISGIEVKATPEEVEAVQEFSKILVEDYNYPKSQIITHPQYRVKVRPSDVKKEYPVDIAVFTSEEKSEDTISIIVECKKKNRKDGKSQLEDYLRFSKASLGVWYNGNERLYLRKVEKKGRVLFEEIPNIPRCGETLEDIKFIKKDYLQPTHNLKSTFRAIRNKLAANAVGATRDEVLAQQLINIIFTKIYDERFTKDDEVLKFHAAIDEDAETVKNRIISLFNAVKTKYKEVFQEDDIISLDANSVAYVVGELQTCSFLKAERDVLADAFETFISHALKGGQGQFFTPRNVVKMMVKVLQPRNDEMIIDPACGSGGFLVESLRYIWDQTEELAREYGWDGINLAEEKINVANTCIRGIDKDYFLTKLTKAYMAIMGDGKGGIFCEDSLDIPKNWSNKTQQKIDLGKFDVVLTNPPFGAKIPVTGEEKLSQYDLAHRWKLDKKSGTWGIEKLSEKEAPQILFIERCVQLLRDGGRMGIVLPEGIFGNNLLGYIRQYLLEHGRILGIVDLPIETFMPNTSTKCSVLFFQKLPQDAIPKNYSIFMALANSCGHDRRGKETTEDDIELIPNEFVNWAAKSAVQLHYDGNI